MQQGSSQVSSGNISPLREPQRDTKEVIVPGAVVLFLGGLLAAVWLYSQSSDQGNGIPVMERIDHATVPDLFKKPTVVNHAEASTTHPTQVTTLGLSMPDIIHVDIHFEVGRKGLTDEGKTQLSAQADLLRPHEDYGCADSTLYRPAVAEADRLALALRNRYSIFIAVRWSRFFIFESLDKYETPLLMQERLSTGNF